MSKRVRIVIFFLLISLIGGVLIHYGTRWGPWTDDDSAEYFEAARNLASGRGLVLVRASGSVRPLSSRPPFYSVVLSIGPWMGVDLFSFARWLDIFLYALFLFLVGFVSYQFLSNFTLSCVFVAFFLVSPGYLKSFTSGLAEPLFFTLAVSSLFLLISYFQTGERWSFFASSILAGLSLLTRLSGAAVVGAGVVALAFFGTRRTGQRLKDVILYGLISALGVGCWIYQVYAMGETAGLYQFDFSNLWERMTPARGGFVNYGWGLLPYSAALPELPYRTKLFVFLLLGLLLLALLGLALKRTRALDLSRWRRNAHLQVVAIFSTYTLVYLAVFLFSHLFMRIPRALVIERHLIPVDLGVILAAFTLGAYLMESFGWPRWTNLLLVVLIFGLLYPNVQPSAALLSRLHEQGYRFSSKRWHRSPLMEDVRELPEDMTLISNESEAILLWAKRPAYRVPEIWERRRVEPFTTFGENQEDPVEKAFREQQAALVLFDSAIHQFRGIYGDEANWRLKVFVDGLYPYVERADGTIYFYEAYPGGE